MLSRTRTSEGGFTLIELLVAAAIGMVVIGVSLVMIIDGVKGSQSAGAGRRAQAEANRVLDELGTDLRAAAAPERLDIDAASTRARLREGLSSVTANNHAFEDIARASETELAFRADAVAEPAGVDRNIECVAYRVENAGAYDRLMRRVWTNASPCPGTGTAMTRQMTRLYRAQGAAPPVFRYIVATPIPGAPDPVCQPVVRANVTSPAQRVRITGVQVNLRGVVRDSRAVQGLDTAGAIDVWSRLTGDYQYAIGCAA